MSLMDRVDGYAPIRDYALIGDGRTTALIALDGSVDWLCLPNVDSGAVFARILDSEGGGSFQLSPLEPFQANRRYRPGTNVLETTFRTASGAVRVTDGMTLTGRSDLSPLRELVRRIEGLEGRVRLRWRFEPRFGFGRKRTRLGRRAGQVVAWAGADAMALGAWNAGEALPRADRAVGAEFELGAGERALLAVAGTHQEPLVLSRRGEAERRLDHTAEFWERWSGRAEYDGPWRELVVRSALALKLLVHSPSGAIVAAPTTSLPEQIGGVRNWDYRFTWLRDAAHTLDALLRLGYVDESEAFFWWFMHASRRDRPGLQVLYRVNGGHRAPERDLAELEGYRGSRPVRIGNSAVSQIQLDVYGAVLDSISLFVNKVHPLDPETGKEAAELADHVAASWRRPDSGIWEVQSPETHFMQSKALCCVGLERACRLAAQRAIPDHRERWGEEARRIRAYVDEAGWDEERGSYVRASDLRELDGSLLTLSIFEYDDPAGPRLQGTLDAVRRELADGPFVWRYRGDDGVPGQEGAFLTCSFWLVDALARAGRLDEAHELMDELAGLANDVGLYSEEIDPSTGEFLGNFPQALTQVALVNAAATIAEKERE
jgi:GH15 family glucan-1,4-alpha-glucosidase